MFTRKKELPVVHLTMSTYSMGILPRCWFEDHTVEQFALKESDVSKVTCLTCLRLELEKLQDEAEELKKSSRALRVNEVRLQNHIFAPNVLNASEIYSQTKTLMDGYVKQPKHYRWAMDGGSLCVHDNPSARFQDVTANRSKVTCKICLSMLTPTKEENDMTTYDSTADEKPRIRFANGCSIGWADTDENGQVGSVMIHQDFVNPDRGVSIAIVNADPNLPTSPVVPGFYRYTNTKAHDYLYLLNESGEWWCVYRSGQFVATTWSNIARAGKADTLVRV